MDKGQRIRFGISFISLTVCLFLLVFSLFAWYINNQSAQASNITAVTSNDSQVNFIDEVKAVRYNLTGDIITNTYERESGGRLVLKKSVIYTAETDTTETITEFETKTYFVMTEMLPGEYVDITIGFSMTDKNDGRNFRIMLRDITADSFVVDGYTHYVTGAFKYRSMSLKDEAHKNTANYNVTGFTPDSDYTWMNNYYIDRNDSSTLDITTMTHTWDIDYENLYYTFRVYEDFTQYYRLIGQASNSYGNLLSQKNLNVGEIYLLLR